MPRAQDQSVTFTAIALAESGGNSGAGAPQTDNVPLVFPMVPLDSSHAPPDVVITPGDGGSPEIIEVVGITPQDVLELVSAVHDFAAAASTELQEFDTSGLIGSEPGPDFGRDVVDAADFVVWRKNLNTDDPPPPEHPYALGELVSGAASDHDQPQLFGTDLLEPFVPPSPIEPGAVADLVLELVPPAILDLEPGQPIEPPAGPPDVTPPTAPPGAAISSEVLAMVGVPDLGTITFVHTGLSPEAQAHGPA